VGEPGARVLTFPEFALPEELRAQILSLHHADPSRREPLYSHDPVLRLLSMVLVSDGRVLAALDILSKNIVHAGERYAASGLRRVVTHPDERRKGYGRQLVRAARDAMAASGADLGIFTCDRPLCSFYERCGWQTLPGTVLIGGTPDRPFPSDQFDKVTLACFFSAKARLHAPTFDHCRIALYSGDIDRLW
jgi:aminoglycoside 2'-N-acetyltransferase I